jgi:hypothetical protein
MPGLSLRQHALSCRAGQATAPVARAAAFSASRWAGRAWRVPPSTLQGALRRDPPRVPSASAGGRDARPTEAARARESAVALARPHRANAFSGSASRNSSLTPSGLAAGHPSPLHGEGNCTPRRPATRADVTALSTQWRGKEPGAAGREGEARRKPRSRVAARMRSPWGSGPDRRPHGAGCVKGCAISADEQRPGWGASTARSTGEHHARTIG